MTVNQGRQVRILLPEPFLRRPTIKKSAQDLLELIRATGINGLPDTKVENNSDLRFLLSEGFIFWRLCDVGRRWGYRYYDIKFKGSL